MLLCRQRVSTILHLEDAQRTQRNPDRTQKPDIIDRYSQYSSGVYAPMQREGRFPDSRPVDQRIDTRPYQPSTYAELLELEASLPQRHLMAKVQVRKVPCGGDEVGTWALSPSIGNKAKSPLCFTPAGRTTCTVAKPQQQYLCVLVTDLAALLACRHQAVCTS
jgi:hypothetical protein